MRLYTIKPNLIHIFGIFVLSVCFLFTLKAIYSNDETPIASLTLNGEAVFSVLWSPDGTKLASVGTDKNVNIWDATNWQLERSLIGHKAGVISVKWSPDGNKLASISVDEILIIWNVENGEILRTSAIDEHAKDILIWSSDSKKLMSFGSSVNSTVQIWDSNLGRLILTVKGHGNFLAFSPDFDWYIAGMKAGDYVKSKLEGIQFTGIPEDIVPAVWSADGKYVAVVDEKMMLNVWNVIDAQRIVSLQMDSEPLLLSWSPDSKNLAVFNTSHKLFVWNITTLTKTTFFTAPQGYEIFSDSSKKLVWSKDSSHLAAISGYPANEIDKAGLHEILLIWDVNSSQLTQIVQNRASISSVDWSSDGSKLALGDFEGVKIWAVQIN